MNKNLKSSYYRATKSIHAILLFCTILFIVPSKIISLEVVRQLISAVGEADILGVRQAIVGLGVLCILLIITRICRDFTKFKLVMGLNCKIEDESLEALKLSLTDKSSADLIFGKIQNTVEKYCNLIYEQFTGWIEAVIVIMLLSLYIGSFDPWVLLGIYVVSLVLLAFSLRKAKLVPAAKEAFEMEASRVSAVTMEYINNAEVASFLENGKLFAPYRRQAEKMAAALLGFNKVNNQVRLFGRFAFLATISLYFVYLFLTADLHTFNFADALIMAMAIPILTDAIFRVPLLVFERKSVKGMENIVDTLLPEGGGKITDESYGTSGKVNSLLPDGEVKGTDEIYDVSGGIEIRNLRFSYDSQSKPIILERGYAACGKLAFFVGPSGSGKTTLMRLFTRQLKPVSGEVLWDGVVLARQPRNVLVLLEPVCFADTIASNIALSDEACTSKLTEVMKAVGLDRVFDNPSEWLTRMVSPGQLSSGEIQKLSLARTFYHSHKHWFLDETTSAMDKASEAEVFKKFREHAKNSKGIVMVSTHNLAYITDDDTVFYVTDDGVCICDTHQNLISGNPSYKDYLSSSGV